jgi:hypothetical protein
MTTFGPECHLLGSMVTGDFNFARNGAVIQVPTLSSNLPWGMPGPATQTTAKVQSYYREQ